MLHDPILNVFEVRASTDKIRRSLPIASLGYMNRLKHLGHGNGDDTLTPSKNYPMTATLVGGLCYS
ncbi:hypothetical protein [Helicobacter pylori]|uniref:hypothetical protein n=1 Tax=Helicobacter pylori TaxID=210 RepID=UPI001E60DFA0|nr:hypothetical protein [Helicobacter pylori]